jgi:tRNA pseudouridine65 synthase
VFLEIVYRDDYLIAINKPHGLLVHRSSIAKDAEQYAMQLLRDQIGRKVYPVHRLDRKTAGVLLFALDSETHTALSKQFQVQAVRKEYLAVVRGYTQDKEIIDYPLKNEKGKVQEALTNYSTISRSEIPFALEKHSTQRYSLVRVHPETGRMHQIRRHFSHIDHPIIGDRPHGCNKQNRFFKKEFGMETMLLHASKLEFNHPVYDKIIEIHAEPHPVFDQMIRTLGLSL